MTTPDQPVRYSLLLDRGPHKALRRFALEHDVDASEVVRALLALLEQDDIALRVEAALRTSDERPAR